LAKGPLARRAIWKSPLLGGCVEHWSWGEPGRPGHGTGQRQSEYRPIQPNEGKWR